MFKKGDYIITLNVKIKGNHYNCGRDNFIFKQRTDCKYIQPCLDLKGSDDNGHSILSFDKKEHLIDWRYATPQEIEHYEFLGKPYDVSLANPEINYEIY